jgi:hypothetical protein
MRSNIPTVAALALSTAFAFGAPALSADLPQAGSFTTHMAGKAALKHFESEIITLWLPGPAGVSCTMTPATGRFIWGALSANGRQTK